MNEPQEPHPELDEADPEGEAWEGWVYMRIQAPWYRRWWFGLRTWLPGGPRPPKHPQKPLDGFDD